MCTHKIDLCLLCEHFLQSQIQIELILFRLGHKPHFYSQAYGENTQDSNRSKSRKNAREINSLLLIQLLP